MITKEQAADYFRPIQDDLSKLILECWNKIHATNLNFKARSRACLMWDETFYSANLLLCDSPHIQYIEEKASQTAHFWFDDKTFFRIKKGDEKGFTRNYPTQSALEFHEKQSDLYGLENRLELTYVLSPDETKITDIAVVHRNGNNINFRFSLLSRHNVQQIPDSGKQAATANQESPSSVAKLKTNPNKKQDEEGV